MPNNIELEVEEKYNSAAEEYKYPKGVVDLDAYNKYLVYKNKWEKHIKRFITIQKIEIDLADSPSKIEKKIDNLKISKDRKEEILSINKEIYSLIENSVLFKKRAFGDNRVNLEKEGFVADEVSGVTPFIIDLAGRFFKAEEIHRCICEDLEITSVTVYQIKKVIKENLQKIKDLQEEYQKNYSDVRLAYKRSRLDELQFIYSRRKSIYNSSLSREDEKQLLQIMESIKKEIQGDLVVNANVNLQIEEKSNQFIEQEILKRLNITMFVIARICGKLNVNPNLILSRLAHSRYAQFSGFSNNGLSSTANTDVIDYASNITYNWDSISAQNEDYTKQNEKLAELPTINKGNKNLKEELLKKLKEAKKPLLESKEHIKENNS